MTFQGGCKNLIYNVDGMNLLCLAKIGQIILAAGSV
jgi:hypothetical protein